MEPVGFFFPTCIAHCLLLIYVYVNFSMRHGLILSYFQTYNLNSTNCLFVCLDGVSGSPVFPGLNYLAERDFELLTLPSSPCIDYNVQLCPLVQAATFSCRFSHPCVFLLMGFFLLPWSSCRSCQETLHLNQEGSWCVSASSRASCLTVILSNAFLGVGDAGCPMQISAPASIGELFLLELGFKC